MSRCLSIPPVGPLMISDEDPAALARQLLRTNSLDVVIARALGRDPLHVLYVDDWGSVKPLPLNRRAWALYGGSPIYGLAVLAADSDRPLDDEIIEMISATNFPPPEINEAMDTFLREQR